MKIESLIRRAGGTRVTLDDTTYHFQPSASDDRHLADVAHPPHVKRLLAIPEGYAPAELSDTGLGTINQSPTGQQPTLGGADDRSNHLEFMTPNDLRALAKEAEIEGFEGMDKPTLLAALKKAMGEGEPEPEDANEDEDGQGEGDGGHNSGQGGADETGEDGGSGDNGGESGGQGGDGAGSDELTHEQLVAAYKEKFGKNPHHKLSDARIKQILAEEDDA